MAVFNSALALVTAAQWLTHSRYPGAGSDSGHKLSLLVSRLPLGLLKVV